MYRKVTFIIFAIAFISVISACSNTPSDATSSSDDVIVSGGGSIISTNTGLNIEIIEGSSGNVVVDNSETDGLTVSVGAFIASLSLNISRSEGSIIELMINGTLVESYTSSMDPISIPFSSDQTIAEVELVNVRENGSVIGRVTFTLQREVVANSNLIIDITSEIEHFRGIDADAERYVVGSPAQNNVTILKKVNDRYEVEQEIAPFFKKDRDIFGFSVAIDGNYLAIGAIGDDSNAVGVFEGTNVDELRAHGRNNSSREAGAVYVYKKSIPVSEEDNVWQLVSYIKPSEVKRNQYLGYDLEIVDHGNDLFTLAVSLPSAEVYMKNGRRKVPSFRRGKVNVYSNIHAGELGALELKQTLSVNVENFDKKDFFGYDIDMNERHLVVGALYESSDSNVLANEGLLESGAAFVYSRNSINNNFGTHTFLKADNIQARAKFGASVAVDGNTVFVGSPKNSSSLTGVHEAQDMSVDAVNSGAVHVFSLSHNGMWESEGFIKAPNAEAGDTFGYSVHAYQGVLAVGSPREDGSAQSSLGSFNDAASNSGAVYVYSKNMTSNQWENVAYLKSPTVLENAHIGIKNIRIHRDQIFVSRGRGGLNL